jgi:tRNA-dihydrouridine synthase 1
MASQTDPAAQGGIATTALSNGVAQANGNKTKLHGRAFYESIGSPKMVLAPMVEQSEFVRLPSYSLPTAEHGS